MTISSPPHRIIRLCSRRDVSLKYRSCYPSSSLENKCKDRPRACFWGQVFRNGMGVYNIYLFTLMVSFHGLSLVLNNDTLCTTEYHNFTLSSKKTFSSRVLCATGKGRKTSLNCVLILIKTFFGRKSIVNNYNIRIHLIYLF